MVFKNVLVQGFGILRGKGRVDVGSDMTKEAYICKNCRRIQFKY